ncbi:MAG: RHS repeat-associated core domain-containing protein [Bacteroidota bacterium]
MSTVLTHSRFWVSTAVVLLISLLTFEQAQAVNPPPTPRITLQSPARTQLVGYDGETMTFSSSTSSANCGSITNRSWYLDGAYVGGSTTLSRTFNLPGGTEQQTYSLRLQVRNSCNLTANTTVTVTVRRDQAVYFITDHLGSVRTTVAETGEVIGYDDYYAFGLQMPGRSSNSSNPNDNYKFTGHERDDEAGLTIDYMMARNYDPIIGRFMQIDPKYNLYRGWTPYHYTLNNPLRYTDPTGECIKELPCPEILKPVKEFFEKNELVIDLSMSTSLGLQIGVEADRIGGFTANAGSYEVTELSSTLILSNEGLEVEEGSTQTEVLGSDGTLDLSQSLSGSYSGFGIEVANEIEVGTLTDDLETFNTTVTVGVGPYYDKRSHDHINKKNTREEGYNLSFSGAAIMGFDVSMNITSRPKK